MKAYSLPDFSSAARRLFEKSKPLFLFSETFVEKVPFPVGIRPGVFQFLSRPKISLYGREKFYYFYRLRLMEAYGTGILKINESYDDYAVKPVIETTGNADKITLPNTNFHAEEQKAPKCKF